MHGRKESNLQLRVLEARALTDGASAVGGAALGMPRELIPVRNVQRLGGGRGSGAVRVGWPCQFPVFVNVVIEDWPP